MPNDQSVVEHGGENQEEEEEEEGLKGKLWKRSTLT